MSNPNFYYRIKTREPTKEDLVKTSLGGPKEPVDSSPCEFDLIGKDELDRLVERLPDLEPDDSTSGDYFRRDETVKPPEVGGVESVPFPPEDLEEMPDVGEDEPLRVLQTIPLPLPKGEVPIVEHLPYVSMSFNLPMVNIGARFEESPIPFKIEPETKGEFRWIGDKMVAFYPDKRLPYSTEFVMKCPTDTKSVTGVGMKKGIKLRFRTISLKISETVPHKTSPVSHLPVIILRMNQSIDPKKLIKFLSLDDQSTDQPTEYPLKLLTEEEAKEIIESTTMKIKEPVLYSQYKRMFNDTKTYPGCFIFLQPKKYLPAQTEYYLALRKGAPSVEGPLVTSDEIWTTIRTYHKFSLYRHGIQRKLWPNGVLNLFFSNNIDLDFFDPKKHVKVEPKVENMSINRQGSMIGFRGEWKGNEKYKFMISKELRDIFGQKLGKNESHSLSCEPYTPRLWTYQSGITKVDPRNPIYSIWCQMISSIHVMIWQVDPKEFHYSYFGGDRPQPPLIKSYDPVANINCGKLVYDETLDTKCDMTSGDPIELKLDLRKHLQHKKEALGQLVIYVEPKQFLNFVKFKSRRNIFSWIQCTNIGLDVLSCHRRKLHVVASQLSSGRPIDNSKISTSCELITKKGNWNQIGAEEGKVIEPGIFSSIFGTGSGGKDSLAKKRDYSKNTISIKGKNDGTTTTVITIPEPDPKKPYLINHGSIVVARRGKDICFTNGISQVSSKDDWVYSMFSDRKLYKPREEVDIKGFLRQYTYDKNENDSLVIKLPEIGQKIGFTARDYFGKEFAKGECEVKKYGAFHIHFKIPDDVNLGDAYVNVTPNINHRMNCLCIKIQEFRTPEFSVTSRIVPSQKHFLSDEMCIIDSTANYYGGGAMVGIDSRYNITQNVKTYTPPNRFEYTFVGRLPPTANYWSELKTSSMNGKTDGAGNHKIVLEYPSSESTKYPVSVDVQTTIQDINYQTMSSSTNFMIHPCPLYVGMKMDKMFVRVDEEFDLEVIVTDIEGKELIGGHEVLIMIKKESIKQQGWNKESKEDVIEELKLVTKQGESVTSKLKLKKGGRYNIYSQIIDPISGKQNSTVVNITVTGGRKMNPSKKERGSKLIAEEMRMIANQKTYRVGEEAKILVECPLELPCFGYFSVLQEGLIHREPIEFTDTDSKILTVPITEKQLNSKQLRLHVFVNGIKSLDGNIKKKKKEEKEEVEGEDDDDEEEEKVKKKKKKKKKRYIHPTFAKGNINLIIENKGVEIDLIPKHKVLTPGSESEAKVVIKSFEGKEDRSGFHVCFFIVDESVLELAGYPDIPDPLEQFRYSGSSSFQLMSRTQYFVRNRHPDNTGDIIETGGIDDCTRTTTATSALLEDCDKRCEEQCCMKKAKGGGALFGFIGGAMSRSCKCDSVSRAPGQASAGLRQRSCCGKQHFCGLPMSGEDCAGDSISSAPVEKIKIRKDFRPLVVFRDIVEMEENGEVVIPFKLPDNLTSYIIHAVCYKNEMMFGKAKSKIDARQIFSLRPSYPRFLNFGDEASMCVVLQNQSMEDLELSIAIRSDEHFKLLRVVKTSEKKEEEEEEEEEEGEGDDDDKSGQVEEIVQEIDYIGVKIKIAKEKREEFKFVVKAGKVGKGKIQVIAQTNGPSQYCDAVEKEIPIYTPTTSENFAVYGEIDADSKPVSHSVEKPRIQDVYKGYGGLNLSFTSTALQGLTDAYISCVNYPYECLEQTSTRILSIVALEDFFSQFNVPGLPPPRELSELVGTCMKKLEMSQKSDGSYGFFTKLSPTNVFLSLHVSMMMIHVSLQGKYSNKKYTKDFKSMMTKSIRFLKEIKSHLRSVWYFWVSRTTKWNLRAFSLYLRTLYVITRNNRTFASELMKEDNTVAKKQEEIEETEGEDDDDEEEGKKKDVMKDAEIKKQRMEWKKTELENILKTAQALVEAEKSGKGEMSIEGKAWLSYALAHSDRLAHPYVRQFLRHVDSNVNQTAEAAWFVTNYRVEKESRMVMLHSSKRTNSILLSVLMSLQPKSSLIAKIVKGIMKSRKRKVGHWGSTQENIYTLLALKKYFKKYEAEVPDFRIAGWLGKDLYSGEVKFKGRETTTKVVSIPMDKIVVEKKNEDDEEEEEEVRKPTPLILLKRGTGRCYYRVGMKYAPRLTLDKMKRGKDYGFVIERSYEDPSDGEQKEIVKYSEDENTWKIKAGELIRVVVKMSTPSMKYHVALVDHLPAGFEVLNPEFKSTQSLPMYEKNDDGGINVSQGRNKRFGLGNWFEHQNLRDDRVEAFSSYIYAGVYEYTYLCRATTKGKFVALPAKAVEMYSPEVYGYSGVDYVTIL